MKPQLTHSLTNSVRYMKYEIGNYEPKESANYFQSFEKCSVDRYGQMCNHALLH